MRNGSKKLFSIVRSSFVDLFRSDLHPLTGAPPPRPRDRWFFFTPLARFCLLATDHSSNRSKPLTATTSTPSIKWAVTLMPPRTRTVFPP
jgi:hypothetical protein